MPDPAMPPHYAGPPYATKSNGAAIASLIFGILGCVPFLTSLLAVILGAIGIRATRDPAVGGKGIAIAGLVLGILGLIGWSFGIGSIVMLLKGAEPAKIETSAFMRALSDGDIESARAHCAAGIRRETIEEAAAKVSEWGELQDISYSGVNWAAEGGTFRWDLGGKATFEKNTAPVEFTVAFVNEGFKIVSFRID